MGLVIPSAGNEPCRQVVRQKIEHQGLEQGLPERKHGVAARQRAVLQVERRALAEPDRERLHRHQPASRDRRRDRNGSVVHGMVEQRRVVAGGRFLG